MRNWNPSSSRAIRSPTSSFDRTYEELKHSNSLKLTLNGQSFDRTYEELKLANECEVTGFYILFWSYLWGIETVSADRPKNYLPGRFWSYLWGIETSAAKSSWRFRRSRVLIVPMRNWNQNWCNFFLPSLSCMFWSYLWGIETGNRRTAGVHQRIRSDRTYEELKQACHRVVVEIAHERVLIVPMRNWNSEKSTSNPLLRFAVLIVPMRNWNQSSPGWASIPPPLFWSYLWGIETAPGFLWTFALSYGSDRTYEELKRDSSEHERLTSCVLIVPVRNWNTSQLAFSAVTGSGSDRTYEELKPATVLLLRIPLAEVLIVPMRNWNNLNGILHRKRLPEVLIVPMRNWNPA